MKTAICLTAALLLNLACQPAGDEPVTGTGTAEEHADEPTNRIEISPTVRSNLGITFAEVELRRVAQTIRVPGAFELRPRGRHEYRMELPGRVELLVDQYEAVEAGQVLYHFQSPAWPELLHEIIQGEQATETALAEIAVARAKAEEARRKLELGRARLEALARADFKRADLESEAAQLEASLPRLEAEIELAETRLRNARRTREHALHRAATASGMADSQLERLVVVGDENVPRYQTIDWIDVRAVHAGVVETLAITDGAFVEPTGMVLSVVDPKQVRFRALALQGDLPQLMETFQARIVPPQSAGIAIGEAVGARMTFGLEAHPRERTMTLLATPEALAPWIRPGVSAFLEVEVDSSAAAALAVPRSAIVRDGLAHVLFRRDPNDPNAAVRIEADMGTSDGRWVVLHSGVMHGDEVVLAGAYELKLAMDRRGGDPGGGHVHADGSSHDDH